MITKDIALTLHLGQILHHISVKNADGTPLRVRVNGKCQTWKTRPDEFRIPVKHGLYDHGEITKFNGDEWKLSENE